MPFGRTFGGGLVLALTRIRLSHGRRVAGLPYYLIGVHRLAPATVNKQLVAIRSFYAYLVETGRTESNPTRHLRLWRSQQAPAPRWLSDAERDA